MTTEQEIILKINELNFLLTGGAKEKRLKNIRHWEEVKEKNAKRSN